MKEKWRNLSAGDTLKAIFWLFTAALLAAAIISPDRGEMFSGLLRIYTQPAQVTKDYFAIGSVSAAFFNAFTVALLCSLLYQFGKIEVTGTSFLAFSLTLGFCFWGMHLLNVLPCFAGVLLYCLVKKEKVSANLNFFLFSTGIAPLITDLWLRYPGTELHGYTAGSLVLGIAVGLFIGFITPAGCAMAPKFHKGFSLYSAALPCGLTAFFLRAVLFTVMGGTLPPTEAVLGPARPAWFYGFLGTLFVLCILLGWLKTGTLKPYRKVLAGSGHSMDFSRSIDAGTAVMNIGIYGLFIMLYYTLVRAPLNGVTLGLVLCMVSTAVSGSHPGNVWPIMLGYIVMSTISKTFYLGDTFTLAINAQPIVIGLCYANGLSPVSGTYGWFAGMLAGMLHYSFVTLVPYFHGGYCLYNGGFTACLVVLLLLPLLDRFFKTKSHDLK